MIKYKKILEKYILLGWAFSWMFFLLDSQIAALFRQSSDDFVIIKNILFWPQFESFMDFMYSFPLFSDNQGFSLAVLGFFIWPSIVGAMYGFIVAVLIILYKRNSILNK
jgi:uncharacterized membrane protein YesL